jgi:site-specific recombinase XerD
MRNHNLLGPWIRRFLVEHLVSERNLARNTQMSYRDALVILLPFVAGALKTQVDKLTVDDLSPEIVRTFLNYLETDRKCSGATRNARLGAIHSLARYIGNHSPEHVAWCGTMRNIPFRKVGQPTMAYLDKQEIEAILNSPTRRTAQGERDYSLLLFLYNTGARVDEAVRVAIGDISWNGTASVRLNGKGSKIRRCPIWPITLEVLKPLIAGRSDDQRVFLNRLGLPLTRFGAYDLVERHVARATSVVPSLSRKTISPHTFRHTTAVHLLRSGVDINTIRAWLGHVSLDTTHIYAEVDLEMKSKALAHFDLPDIGRHKAKRPDASTLSFLRGL